MRRLPFKLDNGVNPIYIEVDHTIEGHVVIRKHDWKLILKILSYSNEINEFNDVDWKSGVSV